MESRAGTKGGSSPNLLLLPLYGIIIQSHYHGPEFRTAEHKHPYHSLLYVVSGEGNCFIGAQSYKLLPNTAIMLKKGQRHQLIDQPGKAMVVFVVYFSQFVAKANEGIFYPLLESERPVLIPVHQAEQIRKNLRQMLHEQDHKPVKFETAIQQCLSSIILQIYRANLEENRISSQPDDTSISRVERVLEYIAERYYEPHSLSEAAGMAHLSQRQFTNLCRKLTNKSFVEYVNTTRLQKAKELLVNSDVPVSAVAFEVGFEEMSTFYRAFNKYYKVPPLSFRA